MENTNKLAKALQKPEFTYQFSICTLVTRKAEYEEMLTSFIEAGFTENTCEFLYLDNSVANDYDAYTGVNIFLKQAKGKYIIICHQDVLLNKDNIQDLESCLKELDKIDPNWGLCGNAGGVAPNHIVYHISYPSRDMSKGAFPIKVKSIDENFIVVKNHAQLSVSGDIKGFHLYATELCLIAEIKGYTAYAVKFALHIRAMEKLILHILIYRNKFQISITSFLETVGFKQIARGSI